MIRSSLESKLYILQSALANYHLPPSGPNADPGGLSHRADPDHFSLPDAGRPFSLGYLLEHPRSGQLGWLARLYLLDIAEQRRPGLALAGDAAAARTNPGRRENLPPIPPLALPRWSCLGRVGEVVRPYLDSNANRIARYPPRRRPGCWNERWICWSFFFSSVRRCSGFRSIPKFGPMLAAGGYVFGATGAICLILLLAFRSPRSHAQQRILSALTFLPPEPYRRAEHTLEAFARGSGLHPQSAIIDTFSRLHGP